MSELSLAESMARAESRLPESARKARSDRGSTRLSPQVEAELVRLLGTHERPAVLDVLRALAVYCRRQRLKPPSRASIYNAMARVEPPSYPLADLPEAVRRCLRNVGGERVPGHQVAFAAFNYGDERALSFGAGLPWSCLYRAEKVPGFRPKSLALLRAVMSWRGL